MMKTEKPLTRDALVSMQVIDAKGHLLGKVKDVVFSVGKMGVSLNVEKEDGETFIVEWEDVQGAADFIIVKPQAAPATAQPETAATAAPAQQAQQLCPTCGKPLTWIAQYQRWYCYNDKKYV